MSVTRRRVAPRVVLRSRATRRGCLQSSRQLSSSGHLVIWSSGHRIQQSQWPND